MNPSNKAIARVKDPLPAPETCPHCGAEVGIVHNSAIYGRGFGEWPWAYRCSSAKCSAYVGMHPHTAIPLGTLATAEIRAARRLAKDAFTTVWTSMARAAWADTKQGRRGESLSGSWGRQMMSDARSRGYTWLAGELGIGNPRECHIGWFDVKQCQAVVEACYKHAREKHGSR